MGRPEPLSDTMSLATTWMSLPNGISFRPTALAGCTSVTDNVQMDRPRYGNVCCNRWNCFPICSLITELLNYLIALYARKRKMAAKMFLMFALKLLTDCYRSNGHGNKKDKGCENIFEHLQVVTNTFNKKFIFQVKTNHTITLCTVLCIKHFVIKLSCKCIAAWLTTAQFHIIFILYKNASQLWSQQMPGMKTNKWILLEPSIFHSLQNFTACCQKKFCQAAEPTDCHTIWLNLLKTFATPCQSGLCMQGTKQPFCIWDLKC